MTDIEKAKEALIGHTLALCRDGIVITSDKRGVAPMLDFLREGKRFVGYSAADRVVGKSAAMLFIKAGIKEIYAGVISTAAENILLMHGIAVSCAEKTERIMNRDKTGLCPMESAVYDTDDIEAGFSVIERKYDEMRKRNFG